jgi:hypothetical protein
MAMKLSDIAASEGYESPIHMIVEALPLYESVDAYARHLQVAGNSIRHHLRAAGYVAETVSHVRLTRVSAPPVALPITTTRNSAPPESVDDIPF